MRVFSRDWRGAQVNRSPSSKSDCERSYSAQEEGRQGRAVRGSSGRVNPEQGERRGGHSKKVEGVLGREFGDLEKGVFAVRGLSKKSQLEV